MSSQDWSDQKKRDVIILHQPSPGRIEYSVPRKEKRISCITTISTAGDVLMPLRVIHGKTVDDAVWEDGRPDGHDFLIRSNDTSYATRPIFKEYIADLVPNYFNTTGETMHLENFAGVLLCDNWSSHIDEEVMAMLAPENIWLITFPPHTSHLFQPLDLVTFAAFKREKREIHVTHPEGSQAWQIANLIKALTHATDSSNNRAAFK